MISLARRMFRGALIVVGLRIALRLFKTYSGNGDNSLLPLSPLRPLRYDEVPPSDSVFIVETNEAAVDIRGRTMCALESASRINQGKKVFFLVNNKSPLATVPEYLKQYPNIYVRSLDIEDLAKGTQLEELWFSGQVQASEHHLSHTSDIIRFLLLARFGGMYTDQDVLFLKPLPEKDPNFLISEGNNNFLTSAVLKLEKNHPLMDIVLKRLAVTYDADIWNMNGPAVLTYAVNSYCDNPPKTPPEGDYFAALTCANLKNFGPEYGCPVKAGKFEIYYNESRENELKKMMSKSFVVHYFNKMRVLEMAKGDRDDLKMSEKHPLYKIMKKACPETESKVLQYMVGGQY